MAISEKVLGPEHLQTAFALNNLAGILDAKSDYKGAELLYRRGLEISEKVLGPEHPNTLLFLENLNIFILSKRVIIKKQNLYYIGV